VDIAELHRRTQETWTERLDQIRPGQWDNPTPCSEWTVRQLVNHVAGEDAWTVPLLEGATIEDVGDRFDGDILGDHPIDAATRLAEEAEQAVAVRLPSGGTVHLSYGDEQLDEYVRQLAADHLIHAWDLAASVDGDRVLDPELVEEVARWFADREELYRGGGAIGPRVETAETGPQAELLAAGGRDVAWAPPEP
jgi:uncharacterized protein (TIGR03086 family)